jgi:propanediol dehydratase small subunit
MEMNEKMVAELVRQVIQGMGNTTAPAAAPKAGGLTAEDYPLASKRPDLLVGPRGKKFDELTLENVEKGTVAFDDFRITPKALEYQAQVAEASQSPQVAANLRRAAELTKVPDARVLEIYTALRPHRSRKEELLAIAGELESQYGAKICGAFVREAAQVYEKRRLLAGDLPTA